MDSLKSSIIPNINDNIRKPNIKFINTFDKKEKNNLNLDNNSIKNKEEKYKKKSSDNLEDFMANISISKISINNIDYGNPILRKKIKHVSILGYTRSLIFKKEKNSYYYIKLFRKHLLSEEHLFKSHIKTILLEKEINSKTEESTNVFECFNEL